MAARFEPGLARLTPKGARRRSTGHPWIYRDDVAEIDAGRGFLVRVEDERRRALGWATWSPRSRIALRFVAGPGDEPSDRVAWFAQRLGAALERRAPLAAETDAFRVVSSEADGLPGLIVDRYATVVVLQALTAFVDSHLDHIVPALVELLGPEMVLARNDVRVRELEGLRREIALCHGRRVEEVEIDENGVCFLVDPWGGQKTGFYLDQRPARRHVQALARAKRVLDVCCYTGGFALHAAKGGAARVLAIDSSRAALAAVRRGAERNELGAVDVRHGKAAAVLRELHAAGERFDVVLLDPPAFAKAKGDVEAAHRGYVDLNLRAMRVLAPGGRLLTCSCSYNMRPERFRRALADAGGRARRSFRDLGREPPAVDHPVLLELPESDYLKSWWLEDATPGRRD